MGISVFKNTKVYIASPANTATGGPELLHQLAYNLRKTFNVDARMLYYEFNETKDRNPVSPDYANYNIPWVLDLSSSEDNEHNILIVPEVYDVCLLLRKYVHIRKGIWFLSVDNYYLSRLKKWDLFFPKAVDKILRILGIPPAFEICIEKINIKKRQLKKDSLLKLASFFITNTYRGIRWFEKEGLYPVYYLSEYLNEEFLKTKTDLSQKENIVAYNPKKGFPFTRKIIKYAPEIKFIPIINMTRQQVIEALQKAKVYIDFGNHPGKDRIPREAAILGCCVITGKRGSAAFYEDVSIPEEYKFDDRDENIPEIINKIRDCFENFDERYKDFDHYREVIKNEPQKFVEDLKKIFIKAES